MSLGRAAHSRALQNGVEAILYHGTGRAPTGGQPGMIYFMEDALIVATGKKFPPVNKRSEIENA